MELLKENKEEQICNTDAVFQIAEEYANTGLQMISDEIDFEHFDEDTVMYLLIDKLDEALFLSAN